MNTQSNKRQYPWKILAVLLLVFYIISASGTTSSSASSLNSIPATESPADVVRQQILDIAYLYAHHRWTAVAGPSAPGQLS